MGHPRAADQSQHFHFNKSSDQIPFLTNMKLFVIVCLALIAAVNAAPQGALFDAYVDIAAARASAGDIGLAGVGLDVLEGQLEAFSTAAAAGTVSKAEAAVEEVATPIVVAAA